MKFPLLFALLMAAPSFRFENVATQAGLVQPFLNGGESSKQFIIETTGSGVAFIDYDNDGLLDLFIASGQGSTSRLYHNEGGGRFKDATEAMGLIQSGWAQGVCAGDFDNDGYTDLFITYWGANRLYRNRGGTRFEDVTPRAHLTQDRIRYNTGCAFLDYDNDGHLDLFVSNYLQFDPKTTPKPGANPYCFYRDIAVNCGPRGLPFDRNILYHNNGDGTFEDVSAKSGIAEPDRNYSLGVLTGDFNNDGLTDIYVACDQTPSLLYINKGNGKFEEEGLMRGVALDSNGKALSGMGASAADYEGHGWLSIFRSNFSDERETLYRSQNGRGEFEDVTIAAGLARNTRFVGWGCGFFDFDNDGWKDLLIVNGHVFPEVDSLKLDIHYKDRAILYRNLGNGRFEDVSELAGPGIAERHASRGAAFGDFDNDGRVEVLVNHQNEAPSLLKQAIPIPAHWVLLKLSGTRSNRSAIGAKVKLTAGGRTQIDEVRSGGSYLSQNDLRLHFGLGAATKIDEVRVTWPGGVEQVERNVPIDRVVSITEAGAFGELMRLVDTTQTSAGLLASRLLHLAKPSLGSQVLSDTLASARVRGPEPYFGAMLRYYTVIGDFEAATHAARLARDAGFITLPETQRLLDRLYSERPRAGVDLFGELLASMPASLRSVPDFQFVLRNMRSAAKVDPALAVQSAERILGSIESGAVVPERDQLIMTAGAYLAALDRKRLAWHADLLAPFRERLGTVSLTEVTPGVKHEPDPDLPQFRSALQDVLDTAFGLREQRGKILLINFGESWCPPCRREKPILDKLASEGQANGLVVIGCSEATDPGSALHRDFEVSELPVTLIFNRDGRLISRLTGEQTETELRQAIQVARDGSK